LAGGIKAIAATASIGTAILLARIVPQALDLPNNRQWIDANVALQKEVSERRELEVDLRISEANHRENAELLDLTHDAIVVCNLRNEVLFWNKAHFDVFGRGAGSHARVWAGCEQLRAQPVDFNQFDKAAKQLGLYWLVLNEPPPRSVR
jgi:PAS domain-containing protein